MDTSTPPNHEVTIRTPRLLLRPLQLEDTPHMFRLRSNPKVLFWTTPETDESQSHAWIEARLASGRWWNFAVELLPDEPASGDGALPSAQETETYNTHRPIGVCGGHNLPEIGYMFDPLVWGRGYATEAVAAVVTAYWDVFPQGHPALEGEERDYLMAIVDESNVGSIKVLERNGFRYWKELEEEDPLNGGKVMVTARRLWRPGKGNS